MGSEESVNKPVDMDDINRIVDDYYEKYNVPKTEPLTVEKAMQFQQNQLGRGSERHTKLLRETIEEEFKRWGKPEGTITRDELVQYFIDWYTKNPGAITMKPLQ